MSFKKIVILTVLCVASIHVYGMQKTLSQALEIPEQRQLLNNAQWPTIQEQFVQNTLNIEDFLVAHQEDAACIPSKAIAGKFIKLIDFLPALATPKVFSSASTQPVTSIDIDTDGSIVDGTIVAVLKNGATAIWNSDGSKRCNLVTKEIPMGHHITVARILSDHRIATGACEPGIIVWNREGKQQDYRSTTHSARLLEPTHDGKLLSLGQTSINCLGFDESLLQMIHTPNYEIRSCASLSNGHIMFVAQDSSIYKVYDTGERSIITKLIDIPNCHFTDLALAPSEKFFASSTLNGTIHFCTYDNQSEQAREIISSPQEKSAFTLLAPHTQGLLAAQWLGTAIKIFTWNGDLRYQLDCPPETRITSFALSKTGAICAGLENGSIQVWQPQDGALQSLAELTTDQLCMLQSLLACLSHYKNILHQENVFRLHEESAQFLATLPEPLRRTLVAYFGHPIETDQTAIKFLPQKNPQPPQTTSFIHDQNNNPKILPNFFTQLRSKLLKTLPPIHKPLLTKTIVFCAAVSLALLTRNLWHTHKKMLTLKFNQGYFYLYQTCNQIIKNCRSMHTSAPLLIQYYQRIINYISHAIG